MKKIFALFLFCAIFSQASAAVTQLKFTTDQQTITPDTVSEKLTIQAQDGSGAEQKAEATIHFTLETTSATGKFSSSCDNWKDVEAGSQLYISKNTANRSFCYKDSILGTYTLTARATDSGITPATQSIVVSASGNGNNNEATSTATSTSATTTETTPVYNSTGGGSYSVHSAQVDLSSIENNPPKIGAGRNRLATVNSPVTFEVWQEKSSNQAGSFSWSFGDGSTAMGGKVAHAYVFPGEYNVVLNASYSTGQAVSRTKVLILNH